MNEQVVAENLTKLRKQSGLTQKNLADKINYSDKVISKWERGESLPDVLVLSELANIYDVKLDDIVFGINASRKEKMYTTNLSKTRRPSVIVSVAFALFVFGEILFVALVRDPRWVIASFFLYLICILILGIEINHHEWEQSYKEHHIKVINKFLVTELWIDNKLVDKRNSISAIGVHLEGKIKDEKLKVNVFRFLYFNCDIVIE